MDLYSWIDNTSAKCIALTLFAKSKRKKIIVDKALIKTNEWIMSPYYILMLGLGNSSISRRCYRGLHDTLIERTKSIGNGHLAVNIPLKVLIKYNLTKALPRSKSSQFGRLELKHFSTLRFLHQIT